MKQQKTKEPTIFVCHKSFTDRTGDRCRKGQRFEVYDQDNLECIMAKKSGKGMDIIIDKDKFSEHFVEEDLGIFENNKASLPYYPVYDAFIVGQGLAPKGLEGKCLVVLETYKTILFEENGYQIITFEKK